MEKVFDTHFELTEKTKAQLRKLIAVLPRIDEGRLKMSVFQRDIKLRLEPEPYERRNLEKPDCGTVGCLAGWAAGMEEFKEEVLEGISLHYDRNEPLYRFWRTVTFQMFAPDETSSFRQGALFNFVFGPQNPNSVKAARHRIEYVLEHGVPTVPSFETWIRQCSCRELSEKAEIEMWSAIRG